MQNPLAPIRVVLADSRAGTLLAVLSLLIPEGDIEVIATATSLDAAQRAAAGRDADVLVIDLSMLGGSSRDRIAELCAQLPHTEIVIMTMETSPAYVPAVIGAGASGFVLKEYADVDLVTAVREAAGGRHFVSEKLAA